MEAAAVAGEPCVLSWQWQSPGFRLNRLLFGPLALNRDLQEGVGVASDSVVHVLGSPDLGSERQGVCWMLNCLTPCQDVCWETQAEIAKPGSPMLKLITR